MHTSWNLNEELKFTCRTIQKFPGHFHIWINFRAFFMTGELVSKISVIPQCVGTLNVTHARKPQNLTKCANDTDCIYSPQIPSNFNSTKLFVSHSISKPKPLTFCLGCDLSWLTPPANRTSPYHLSPRTRGPWHFKGRKSGAVKPLRMTRPTG